MSLFKWNRCSANSSQKVSYLVEIGIVVGRACVGGLRPNVFFFRSPQPAAGCVIPGLLIQEDPQVHYAAISTADESTIPCKASSLEGWIQGIVPIGPTGNFNRLRTSLARMESLDHRWKTHPCQPLKPQRKSMAAPRPKTARMPLSTAVMINCTISATTTLTITPTQSMPVASRMEKK